MSPRKVNKNQKRREIALACADLIYEVGMKNLTVSQAAKTAGIGKGTIYEYFENKDDIIFEIIDIHIQRHNNEFDEMVDKVDTTKEKIEIFFRFILDNSEEKRKHFNGYKEFLSIVLSEDNQKMKEFNCDKNDVFKNKLEKILNDAVQNGELKPEILNLVDGILTYHKGLAIRKMTQSDFDERLDFESFINTILDLNKVSK